MWFIDLLPFWIFHAICIAGIVGILLAQFIRFLPLLWPYKLPIQLIALVLLVSGVWFEGGMANEEKWQARVKELEEKVAVAEVKSKETNVQIQTKYVTQIKVIKEQTAQEVQSFKENHAQDLDSICKLPESTVVFHNRTSQNELSASPTDTNGRTSNVKASDLVGTVGENYGTYYELRQKLLAWQEWYKTQKQIFEEVK